MQFKIVLILAIVSVSIAVASARKKTECEIKKADAEQQVENMEKAGRGSSIAILVPKCNDDGSYAQLQCHYKSPFCQCWDKEGKPQSAPKKNLEKCSCLIDRNKAIERAPPSSTDLSDVVSCDRDGSFTPRQCNRTACWCVNPNTGKKLGSESKDKALKC